MKNVRITNDNPVSNYAKLMIGDQIIPFYKATITLETSEFAKIMIEAPIDWIDIVALEKNTEIKLVKERND
jgi:hypothetical protein